jgi:hypothetical protein
MSASTPQRPGNTVVTPPPSTPLMVTRVTQDRTAVAPSLYPEIFDKLSALSSPVLDHVWPGGPRWGSWTRQLSATSWRSWWTRHAPRARGSRIRAVAHRKAGTGELPPPQPGLGYGPAPAHRPREPFVPRVPIIPNDDEEEGGQAANDTWTVLSSADPLWARTIGARAERRLCLRQRRRLGGAWTSTPPFSGVRGSGIGREMGSKASAPSIRSITLPKSTT